MIYKPFKDISVSRLGMGNMRLPTNQDGTIDYEKAQSIIDYAMEKGINYFDTAYVYHGGESETFLGKALKKYPRNSYYIATKFLLSADPDYKSVFEKQLKKLDTDYIDFYLIHAVMDSSYQKYIDCGCIEYFLEQKRLGRIKYLGFSAHASVEKLEIFASHHNWDFAQLQINYFDWKLYDAKQQYEVLEKKNIPIIVMEPVRGGKLANLSPDAEEILKKAHPDWTIPSWAFRFLLSLPQIQLILSGMSNMAQIEDNINTFSEENALSKEDIDVLMNACETFKNHLQVPCTSCRYCCADCPMQIEIPDVISAYNEYKLNGKGALRAINSLKGGKPVDCVACGSCSDHCPQSINIPQIMQEIKDNI